MRRLLLIGLLKRGTNIKFNGDLGTLIQTTIEIYQRIDPNLSYILEICFSRCDEMTYFEHEFVEVLGYNYFKSIDLVGDEQIPVDNFMPIYRKAKEVTMILIAHIGEFFGCGHYFACG